MPDLTLSVLVSRAELLTFDLELNNHDSLSVVGFGPAARRRRNIYNTSGNVHGGTLNNTVLDVLVRPIIVRVTAPNDGGLDSRTTTLIAAFEQTSYTVTITRNGIITALWDCMTCEQISPCTADGQPQDFWDPLQLMSLQHVYRIDVPTQPQSTTGPL